MPQTKLQDIVFTAIMATFMVYGMICFNIAMTGAVPGAMVFIAALRELPLMAAIAFVLEFFLVGRIAKAMAFNVINPRNEEPIVVICVISAYICLIMCPIMSAIATMLFNSNPSVVSFLATYAANLPMAMTYQILLCGPVVRRIFRSLMFVTAL